jgi:uncharacterized Fe-S cluster-containing MiaB family protein
MFIYWLTMEQLMDHAVNKGFSFKQFWNRGLTGSRTRAMSIKFGGIKRR